MNSREIVEKLYNEDGLRNRDFLDKILHQNLVLDWESSIGLRTMSKNEILDMADELKANYQESRVSIIDNVITDNKIVVRYTHQVSSIENPNELFTIAKVLVIWDVENEQITKGFQMSKPE